MLKFNEDKSVLLALYKNTVQIYSQNLEHKGFITCNSLVIDALELSNKMVVVLCDDKTVNIYNDKVLTHHLLLTKKPTSVCEIDNQILVSDKFGDVYRFKIDEMPLATEDINKLKDTIAQNIILAHFSVINQIEISKKKNAIITCDRDEKVRVTRYPRTDIIQSFCYGFVELVTSCKCEEINNIPIVVCGSCDGTMRIYKIENGEEIKMKQFDKNDVVIIYDVEAMNEELHILVGIENKNYYTIKIPVIGNNLGEMQIEKGECIIKGGKFTKDDLIIYNSDDQLIFVNKSQKVNIHTDGANSNFKNEGTLYETLRKTISPKQRFINMEDEETEPQKIFKND
ncbi:wdr4-prov protein, putative [Entamoeba dispar SAW760]|uniref:tRNA (guanine-N(7)-)-methyltransferase non-catalytic subunit n=1 Tax=Entamoeba dispar (strain ATCC PRA-260 / SAW760) TaxID=370354 RepID=B0E864_ENTDS|nr:wdr4-prov protein, putative [Entamoeba dispar SAW760]EDR29283.1 wdr4-prov protein, putative [Entamoeba dispar SAW760]|eukprot:EDR29283.1 wdr4-prov protein, putative [Entamoeba dispar SAW760]